MGQSDSLHEHQTTVAQVGNAVPIVSAGPLGAFLSFKTNVADTRRAREAPNAINSAALSLRLAK